MHTHTHTHTRTHVRTHYIYNITFSKNKSKFGSVMESPHVGIS